MRKLIHKLSAEISNHIAAGEVVERPAAVVKELIENSIDAGAKRITIDIEKAGKKKIRITDDGCGLYKDEIILAFSRHATSKISKLDDIYKIDTLGFRGEALASISAVSMVDILTRPTGQDIGCSMLLSAGQLVEQKEIGCPTGTTIIIRDLFFNTPARLKFLKSDNVETTAIHDIINKLALSHADVAFRYMYNNKHMFTTSGDGDLFKVIHSIYHRDMSEHMISMDYMEQNIKISGYISHVEYSKGNRSFQVFFVNGRYVKSPVLADALAMAYKPMLFPSRFPVCFLNISIPFDTVDVNVHPAKTEIKFHQEGRVKQTLYSGVRTALLEYNQVPRVSPRVDSGVMGLDAVEVGDTQKKHVDIVEVVSENTSGDIENDTQHNIEEIKTEIITQKMPERLEQMVKKPFVYHEDVIKKSDTNNSNMSYEQMPLVKETVKSKAEVYDKLRYLGTLFTTYLLFEKGDRLYMMDQHAAHEKVLYERFLALYLKGEINRQILLHPIVVNLSYGEYETAKANANFYENLGLLIEDFGKNSIVIREIPSIFNVDAARILFEKTTSQISIGSSVQTLVQTQLDHIAQMACKAAIKAHDKIDQREIKALLDDLQQLNDPYTCPHGRPIMISITENEIERKFKRKV